MANSWQKNYFKNIAKLKNEAAKIKQKLNENTSFGSCTGSTYPKSVKKPWIVLTASRLCVALAWGPRVWKKLENVLKTACVHGWTYRPSIGYSLSHTL